MTDEELEDEQATVPWYFRGIAGKVVTGAMATIFGAAILWSVSMLMAAASADELAEQNREKIEQVESEQQELKDEILPAIKGVQTEVKRTREDVQGLRSSVEQIRNRE